MIHHILVQNKFYHLEFSNYHEILQLLRQPLSDDPRIIQQNIFKGIVEFNIFHRYLDHLLKRSNRTCTCQSYQQQHIDVDEDLPS